MNDEFTSNEDYPSITLSAWARRREPRLFISAKSEPEPVLLGHNLIAAVVDPEESHELLRKWEGLQPADAHVGFVAMSSTPKADGHLPVEQPGGPVRAGGDPQHVAGHAARRIVRGALPGGLLGAIVIGVIAAILAPDGGNVVAAALGGAAIGFVAGAVISFAVGSGWSEAYKESFVEPASTVITYASIHSDDVDTIRKAAKLADVPGGTMLCVDRSGRVLPLDEPSSH
jgi:hypothetical protein